MDYVKEQAEHFAKNHSRPGTVQDREVKPYLLTALAQFSLYEDRIEFLNSVYRLFESSIKVHQKTCQSPGQCAYERKIGVYQFFINRELENLTREKQADSTRKFSNYIEAINITGNGQVVNLGTIEGGIVNNVETLKRNGELNISEALSELTNGIKESTEITQGERLEYLEHIQYLSEQALIPKEERKTTIVKSVIKHGLGSLNALSSLSTVSGVTLTDIANFFLK